MAVTKKNLTALVEEMLRDGGGFVVNGECCEDGDPDAMRADVDLAHEVITKILRDTPLARLNEIVGSRRLHFNHGS